MKNGRYEDTGTIIWYLNGKRHREDGPAFEKTNGHKEWWFNGKKHRSGGPAVEWQHALKEWFFNGQRHREDGPAVEWDSGHKQWFLHDIEYTEQEYQQWLDKKNLNTKLQVTLPAKPTQKRLKI